jgi:hypothetical protein
MDPVLRSNSRAMHRLEIKIQTHAACLACPRTIATLGFSRKRGPFLPIAQGNRRASYRVAYRLVGFAA